MIRIKRTYDPPARDDGKRILVERLWPRGMKTLLYSAHDSLHSGAVVLRDYLHERKRTKRPGSSAGRIHDGVRKRRR